MSELCECRHCGAQFQRRTKHVRFYCDNVCNDRAAIKRYHNKPEVRAKRLIYFREYWQRKKANNER